MRFDKTPKHGVILIRPERNLYYDSNQDKVQHWHQSPALHHHWYYLHLNVSILVPVSLYRRIRWPQIRVSTLSPAVSLCPSTQRSPGWSVPSSTTIVAGVSLVKVSLCWCPMKCGAPAHPQQPWDWLSLSWLTAVSVAVWDDDWGNFNRESLCNTIVDSLYPVSTQHSSLSTQLHHRHSNGISGHCQQCQASVEFLGNQFPVVGIVSVSITVVCRVWRPASLGTGPYPVPQPPRRQREQYLYIVLFISILEWGISLYISLYLCIRLRNISIFPWLPVSRQPVGLQSIFARQLVAGVTWRLSHFTLPTDSASVCLVLMCDVRSSGATWDWQCQAVCSLASRFLTLLLRLILGQAITVS